MQLSVFSVSAGKESKTNRAGLAGHLDSDHEEAATCRCVKNLEPFRLKETPTKIKTVGLFICSCCLMYVSYFIYFLFPVLFRSPLIFFSFPIDMPRKLKFFD